MNINLDELKKNSLQLTGACSGVYFLFKNDDLVYVGEGWNCLLRVAEHTRKDHLRFKEFTSWSFIQMEDKKERKDLEKQLRKEFNPRYNKV